MVTREKESMIDDSLASVCVFVSSSDNTKDVFLQVSRCFEKYWPDCPYPLYVGLNTPGISLPWRFESMCADACRWQDELSAQLHGLPEQYRYVLLFLDDYYISKPVKTNRVASIINDALGKNLKYIRLVPVSRAILPSIWKKFTRLFQSAPFEELKAGAPYFASLQLTLWDRVHLCNMLKMAKGIWEFENMSIPGIQHFAITEKPPIRYHHLVEKGKWQPHAASVFEKASLSFDPSKRQIHSIRHRFSLWINKFKFAVLGYAVFTFKRRHRVNKSSTGDTS